jgi:hypothetical protein
MSSHLHLHLGAHKTATTHFQQALADISSRASTGYTVVPTERFRQEFTYANRFLNAHHSPKMREYLKNLLAQESTSVLISEENLIGEAKDFIGPFAHYEKAGIRLNTFSSLLPENIDITVWLFIRSLDSFLPSMYCEYLRHWPYAPFEQVLGGRYRHSWVPLIETIRSTMPHANINVLNYESYQDLAPQVLSAMTGEMIHSLPMDTRVIRPRLTNFTVKLSQYLPRILPSSLRMRVLESASSISKRSGSSTGFAPFSQATGRELRLAFQDDLEQIRSMPEVTLVE